MLRRIQSDRSFHSLFVELQGSATVLKNNLASFKDNFAARLSIHTPYYIYTETYIHVQKFKQTKNQHEIIIAG